MNEALLSPKTRQGIPIRYNIRKFDAVPEPKRSNKVVERGNIFVAKLLEILTREDSGFDPYQFEDEEFNFETTTYFMNVNLCIKLFDGYMTGLETLHRTDLCCFREKEGRMLLTAELGAGPLTFEYKGSIQFLLFRVSFSVEVTFFYAKVFMFFTADSSTGKNGSLHKLYLKELTGMHVNVLGIWPLTWMINSICNRAMTFFKRRIGNELEIMLQNHVTERIPLFTFPNKKSIFATHQRSNPSSASPQGSSFLITIEESD